MRTVFRSGHALAAALLLLALGASTAYADNQGLVFTDTPIESVISAPSRRTLLLGTAYGCGQDIVVQRLEQGRRQVRITLAEGSVPSPGTVCADIANFYCVRVVLDAPLGRRVIVDRSRWGGHLRPMPVGIRCHVPGPIVR